MTGTLEGKVALVTGSGRGIGRAIAHKFAAQGARVVVNDLDTDPAQQVVDEIRAAGGIATACSGSVSTADFAERFIGTVMREYQGIDIIVNNAGYTWDSVIQKMTDEQWYAHWLMPSRPQAPYARAAWLIFLLSPVSSAMRVSPTTLWPKPALKV